MNPVVWDVFTYHNEALVLDVRHRELAGLNARHVPVESTATYMGAPRSRALADSFLVVGHPGVPREREAHQRRAGRWALDVAGARHDDWVIFSDVDEIPAVDAVWEIIANGEPRVTRIPYHSILATWRLPLDRDTVHRQWPIVGRFGDLLDIGDLADVRAATEILPYIPDAGWHLSSMGGPACALAKIESFCHSGERWTVGLDVERLRDLARRGRDIADRWDLDEVPVSELPQCLQDDPETFRALLEVCW